MGIWTKLRDMMAGRPVTEEAPNRRRAADLPPPDPDDPIAGFWHFWAKYQPELAAAIDAGSLDLWSPRISALIDAIDPELAWEFGQGQAAKHYFCVTGEGQMPLRVTAERWLSLAPEADGTWEFYAAKPGGSTEGFVLKLPELSVDAEGIQIAVELDEIRVLADLTIFHPEFANVPGKTQLFASFLILDSCLGEDDVERWVGAVKTTAQTLEAPIVRLPQLRQALEPLAEIEEDTHVLYESTTEEGQKLVSVVRVGLKRIDHLLQDNLVSIFIDLPPRDDGLTDADDLEILNDIEDQLFDELGPHGVFIAHETGAGKRTIYLHTDTKGPATRVIEAWQAEHAEFTMQVEMSHDPAWEVLQRW